MRVLFISNNFPPYGYTGGAEVANLHTCRGLIQRGVACSQLILSNRQTTTLNEWYEFDTVPVHRVYVPYPLGVQELYKKDRQVISSRRAWSEVFDWRIYRATLAELRRLKPDIVHIHNVSGATLAPYLACRTLNVPVVNTLHDLWLLCANNMRYRQDGSFCNPKYEPQGCQFCFRRYDYWAPIAYRAQIFAKLTSNVRFFISPSQAVIERHVEAGYERERFRLVRLGFQPEPAAIPEHPGVREIVETRHHYRTLVYAGGGKENKGAHVVWQALPMLLRHVEKFRLVVAGGGEGRFFDQFRQFEPAVKLLGNVPFQEMHTLFGAADLTLIASIWHENSPVIIFESFQAGTPVVSSNFGGIPEFIRHAETGYLFPPANPAVLGECVVMHFARPADERRRMRQRCVQEIQTKLSLDQHLDETLRVYEEVLAS